MPAAISRKPAHQLLSTAIVVGLGLSSSAWALEYPGPDKAQKLESMTVTGKAEQRPASPKYSEPVRDTPQSLTIIPIEIAEQQAQTTLRDVLRNTPGITLQAGEGGGAPGDNVFLRGFSARNDVYVDGVRDPGVLSRDAFNLEAVEIAKGPASAVSGRGSAGGSINLVTKQARDDDFTRLQLRAGSADSYRASFDDNRQIGDHAALRLNAMWQDSGVPGRDAANNSALGIAPSLALGIGTPTELQVNLSHLEFDNLPDYGLPVTLPAGVPDGFDIGDLDWSNFYGLKQRDYEHVNSDQATVIVNHEVSEDMQLRNLTRWGRNTRDAVVTPPRAATAETQGSGWNADIPLIRRNDTKFQDRSDRILSNQTHLGIDTETGGVRHALGVGVELSREESSSYTREDASDTLPLFADFYNPNPNDTYPGEIFLRRTGDEGHAEANSAALYAFDTLHFNEQWQLGLGARWERFDVDYRAISVQDDDGLLIEDFSRADSMFSWRAGLVYKPVERGTFYAAAGNAFTPTADGSQGLTFSTTPGRRGPAQNDPRLGPEETRSMEVGTKWEVGANEGLLLSAALFRNEKINARTTDESGNLVLSGNQEVDGIEIGVSGQLTDSLSLTGGWAWMDSEITESGVDGETGHALPYIPEQSGTLWLTWQASDRWQFGMGAQHSDGHFFSSTDPAVDAPVLDVEKYTRYTLLNAMAGYRINDRATVQINLNNASDERYVERGYGGHFSPGAARQVLATLTFDL
ncbi:MAG: TonB-dependent siderophore receptor [Lysobacteraceae bacterium]|nr:TonB-dependent siderophore receptor [Xanthomonadales bacterium]HPF72007.1 TonB-dependent siderophore receptor [Xanthomonadaceae bacterium]HRX98842.1 TonB-dependent siderophore receptor [Xanthomonadaceae bacterium]